MLSTSSRGWRRRPAHRSWSLWPWLHNTLVAEQDYGEEVMAR